MAKVPGAKTVFDAAELITDVRNVFTNIAKLEEGQKLLVDQLALLDGRVRELEAGLKVAKAEIKVDALKETQIVRQRCARPSLRGYQRSNCTA